jgi:hypothetical protein
VHRKPTQSDVPRLDAFEHLLISSTLHGIRWAREHGWSGAEEIEHLRRELSWVQGHARAEAIEALRLLATDEGAALVLVAEMLERGPLND